MASRSGNDAVARSVLSRRLRNQGLHPPPFTKAVEVVAWHGAVQAQDYAAAKWGLGLRAPALRDAAVDEALARGAILRTHVMRPTWHFVLPRDIRWMLALTADRVRAAMNSYDRKLELDGRVFARSNAALERALGGGVHATREELAEVLGRAGIRAKGQRLGHLMMQAEIDQVVCSGPRRGRKFTYALLAERAPRAKVLPREEALQELALRYFRSHGPATLRDYVWWSGLRVNDARAGIALARPALDHEVVHGLTYWSAPSKPARASAATGAHLLPVYDEYLVAYKDRDLVVDHSRPVVPERQFDYSHSLVMDGRLVGTWRRALNRDSVLVAVESFKPLASTERAKVEAAAERLAKFLECGVTVSYRRRGP
jgi:Winged helix DNA-binding domain